MHESAGGAPDFLPNGQAGVRRRTIEGREIATLRPHQRGESLIRGAGPKGFPWMQARFESGQLEQRVHQFEREVAQAGVTATVQDIECLAHLEAVAHASPERIVHPRQHRARGPARGGHQRQEHPGQLARVCARGHARPHGPF